ncbi:MAG: redoxin domain-containing protein [Armatimonadota bacterium]
MMQTARKRNTTRARWIGVEDAVRVALAGVLLTAVVGKLLDFDGFVPVVNRLELVPATWSAAAAALLLVLETVAATLLLTRSAALAGPLLTLLLAGGFTQVTLRFLLEGRPNTCGCFGLLLQLPPLAVLLLDLTLGLGAFFLLRKGWRARRVALTAQPEIGSSAGVPSGAPLSSFRSGTLWCGCYLLVMVAGLQAGFHAQWQHADDGETREINLRLGDRAPLFRLRTLGGRVITPASLAGEPALVVFVQDGCTPCESELRELATLASELRGHVRPLVVLTGRPLWGSAEAAARRFARRLALPFPVALDPDRTALGRYADRPARTPFSVLLNSAGRVSYVQDGRESGEMSLKRDLQALLADEPYGAPVLASRSPHVGRPAPDGVLSGPAGPVRLSTLWQQGPLLLTFLLPDCPGCRERVALLERAAGANQGLRSIYVYPSAAAAAAARRRLRTQAVVASDPSREVHTRFAVWNAPTSVLIERGRIQLVTGERAGDRELLRALRSVPSAVIGLSTTDLSARRANAKAR